MSLVLDVYGLQTVEIGDEQLACVSQCGGADIDLDIAPSIIDATIAR